jgi:hypothetical protein
MRDLAMDEIELINQALVEERANGRRATFDHEALNFFVT